MRESPCKSSLQGCLRLSHVVPKQPSHGENRSSILLGSANKIKVLHGFLSTPRLASSSFLQQRSGGLFDPVWTARLQLPPQATAAKDRGRTISNGSER